jgi:hypothetical protein
MGAGHLNLPHKLTGCSRRIFEDELHTAVEARTESLQTLRELGPPDLVHLIKTPIKGAPKQVRGIGNPMIWRGLTPTTSSVYTTMSPA